MIVLNKTLLFLLLIIVGYAAYKKNMLDEHASQKISALVINVANPALIISSALTDSSVLSKMDLVYTFVISMILYAVLIVCGCLLSKIFPVTNTDKKMYNVMFLFSNIGFMGFPLMSAILGKESLLVGSVFLLPFNVLVYTYGVYLIGGSTGKITLRTLFNNGIIACILATIIFCFDIKLPSILEDMINMLSGLTAPLSMMVIGVSIAQMKLLDLFKDVKLLLFSFIKLLVLPICLGLVFRRFITNDMIFGVLLIILATPVASILAMFAKSCETNEELSAKGIALTTILSVITIPIVFQFVR